MRHRKHARFTRSIVVLAVLAAAFAAVACTQPTGAERVARLRSEYAAELNSFSVRETPVEPAMAEPMEGEAMADDAMAADDGETMEDGIMDEEMMEPEVRQDVILDIVLRKEGRSEGLDALTIDVFQVDAAEVEKARYRIYVETGGLVNGSSTQVSHILEDVDYTEGDGFQAEVRQDISPQSQADYREFNEAAEGDAGY